MGNGLLVEGESSHVQIDSTYKNMCLATKSTGNLFLHNLNNIYAFRPITTGEEFSVRCYSNDSINCYYETSIEVESFSFGWDVPTSSEGMEIFNELGELVFSSSSKPLKVLDFVSMNISGVSGDVIFTKTYTGKSVAIIPSQIPYNWERNNQNLRGYSTLFNINGSSISVRYGIAKEWSAQRGSLTGSANRNDVFQPYVNFLVVDVTNY